jgi:hypothetical protein
MGFEMASKQMTFIQPADKTIEKVPHGKIHPVTLPVTEAIESVKIVVSDFIKSKKDLFSSFSDASIVPESNCLVYVPFMTGHHDLINEKYHVALNNKILSTAENL